MRRRAPFATLLVLCCALVFPTIAQAKQDAKQKSKSKKSDSLKVREPKADTTRPPLFTSEAPLAVTFTTNVHQLRDDRR